MNDERNAAEPLPQPETTVTDEQDQGQDLIELVLQSHEQQNHVEPALPSRIDGVLVGKLVRFVATDGPYVEYLGSRGPMLARAAMALEPTHVGRNVALLFEGGHPEKPIVMGLMFEPPVASTLPTNRAENSLRPEIETDGERLVLSAEKEIVLRCGQASITLTRAGKILIQGAYLLSRSSGTNRIQGGSVEIN